jgi:hypothetical protein
MIPALRRAFNASWTPAKYRAFLEALDRRVGTHVGFRVCETPCFFPRALLDGIAAAGAELLEQLLASAEYRRASDATIPPEWNVPNESERPLFAAVDFGLIRNERGELEPRLVEIQGFPSLYCFQVAMAQQFVESYGLDPSLGIILGGAGVDDYYRALRGAILGAHDPEHVVLLEIDPQEQKTLPDFLCTERVCGMRTVNIREVIKEGNRLFYAREGKRVPIRRIYNRAIVDELVRKKVALPFRFTDELDVEWAGHPNWFFRISKFSLPYLKHPAVPETKFLDQLVSIPDDLENYVLKPLYSFAGLGVVVGPARADLDAIPAAQRHNYILQRRMRFEPFIETPHGPTQAEIRILYVGQTSRSVPCTSSALAATSTPPALAGPPLPDPCPLSNWTLGPAIVRMGRGKMMGVDHNRDLEWVGASAALYL